MISELRVRIRMPLRCARSSAIRRRMRADSSAPKSLPVTIAGKKGETVVSKDEHPRETTLDALAKLKGVVKPEGTVTAGNASGINDGAVALLIASEAAVQQVRTESDRAAAWRGNCRCSAAHHGHRPGAGDAKAA